MTKRSHSPLATPLGEGRPLPLSGHLWPLATPHREREPHPRPLWGRRAYGQSGSRTPPGAGPHSGHRAKTPLATPIGEAPLHGQREPASPPPRPKGATPCTATHWPNGAPHTATYRPSDAPPGPMATASLTGHLLATYWPSGRPPLATMGRDGTPSPGPYTPDWPPKTDLAK